MKLSLLFSSSIKEAEYVERESKREHGPYVAEAYADFDEEDIWD